ncbi:hypothetical protein YC2023_055396 [Brassica napus]
MVVYPGRCVAVGVTRGYEILAPPRGDDHPVSDVFWRLRERLSHVLVFYIGGILSFCWCLEM